MSKIEAEDCRVIEAWWLLRDIKKKGGTKHSIISWGKNGEHGNITAHISANTEAPSMRLTYSVHTASNKKDFDYTIPITTTPCHFGGLRYWFQCPLIKNNVYCGKRVGKVYMVNNYFGCRHCHEITYASRKISSRHRWNPLYMILDLDMKTEEIYRKRKRLTYKGKLTRTGRKMKMLNESFSRLENQVRHEEE